MEIKKILVELWEKGKKLYFAVGFRFELTRFKGAPVKVVRARFKETRFELTRFKVAPVKVVRARFKEAPVKVVRARFKETRFELTRFKGA